MSTHEFKLVYGSNTFDDDFFQCLQAIYLEQVPEPVKRRKSAEAQKRAQTSRKTVPTLFARVGKTKRDFYWGKRDPQGVLRIGMRGKFWVLALLISQLMQNGDVDHIADQIAQYGGFTEIDLVKSNGHKYTYRALIRDLVSPTFGQTPHADEDLAYRLLDAAVGLLQRLALQGSGRALYDVVVASNYASFAELFKHIRDAAGIMPAMLLPGHKVRLKQEWLALISQMNGLGGHPDQLGVRTEPTPRDLTYIRTIFERLANPEAEDLLVLHGEESSGKKAIIRHFLHMAIARADGYSLYKQPDTGENRSQYLPILAIQGRRKTYVDLIRDVCSFLINLHNASSSPEQQRAHMTDDMEIWEGLQVIRDLNQHAALFVITDVEIAPENRLRPHIRDSGFRRLLSALFDGHANSKIIITTTARWNDVPSSVKAGLPTAESIEVGMPSLAELKFFVRPDLKTLPFPPTWQAQLRGHVLVALGALISLHDRVPPIVEEELIAIRGKRVDVAVRKNFRGTLYGWLREKVRDEGLLPALTLIALSEDGLRSDTLHTGLVEWHALDKTVKTYSDIASLIATLTDFALRAGPKFLKYSEMIRYDKEEYGLGDTHQRSDEVWEFDPLVAQRLIYAVQSNDPSFAQTANRIISIAARRRSQNKRALSSQSGGYDTTADASRDIQSFTSLLASIPADQLLARPPEPKAPISLLRTVFTLGDDFDPRAAFRYAVYGQLRDNIDREHRMTMVDDEDELRLHLYLLLFQLPGKRYNLEDDKLAFPDVIEPHLVELLGVPDVIDFITAVGLSAFHAHRPDILSEAVKRAEFFISENAPDLAHELSRLWSALFDHFILIGGSDGRYAGTDAIATLPGHQKTFEDLAALIGDRFEAEDQLVLEPWSSLLSKIKGNEDRVTAWLRLKARYAELLLLTREDRQPVLQLYNKLLEIDNLLSVSGRPGRGMIFAGRTARHFIRFLFRGPGFHYERNNPAFQAARDDAFDRVAEMIDINMSRLRRYSGADRVGALLDLARWHYFKSDIDTAIKYAVEADNRSFMTNVSHNARLDVLVVNADLFALRLQRYRIPEGAPAELTKTDRDTAMDILTKATDDIDELARLSVQLKYKSYEAIAMFLRAKLDYIARRIGLSDGDDEVAHAAVLEAQTKMASIDDITFKTDMELLEQALNSNLPDLVFH